MPQGVEDFCQLQQIQILLMPSQINQQMKKDLEVTFNANTDISNAIDNAINAIDDGINAIDDVVD